MPKPQYSLDIRCGNCKFVNYDFVIEEEWDVWEYIFYRKFECSRCRLRLSVAGGSEIVE